MTDEISWGSHVNKTFWQAVKVVFKEDLKIIKTLLDLGNSVFIHPFGLCLQITDYDPSKEFVIKIRKTISKIKKMQVFITCSRRMTFSNIHLASHQGSLIADFKKGYTRKYSIQVVMKDLDNPKERDSCTDYRLSSYSDCIDFQTQNIISKVNLDN